MKTQTAEEILMDYLKGDKGKGMTERYAIIAAMEFYHQQQLKILNIPVVMQQSGQLFCSMAGKGFCPYEYENGKCNVEGKCTNHTTK